MNIFQLRSKWIKSKLFTTKLKIASFLILAIFIGLWAENRQGRIVHAAALSVAINQSDDTFTFYVVQPGDTLAAIALAYGVPLDVLLQVNNIADANLIYVGQQLRIPTQITPTTTPTASEVPSPTVTPLPSATLKPTRTATPEPSATKAPTPTKTVTPTASPTLAPAAAGDALWTKPALAIEVFSPVANAIYHSPIEINGYSQTAEGQVVIRLKDGAGNILGTRRAQGGSANGFAFFESYIRFEINQGEQTQAAVLEVFEVSRQDGKEINFVEIPIVLRAGQRNLDLNQPRIGEAQCMPVRIAGYSNTFEGNLSVEVAERTGDLILASGNATGGSLGNFAEFATNLNLELKRALPVLVGVYEIDAQDGRQIDAIRVPISLYPLGSAACK